MNKLHRKNTFQGELPVPLTTQVQGLKSFAGPSRGRYNADGLFSVPIGILNASHPMVMIECQTYQPPLICTIHQAVEKKELLLLTMLLPLLK